MSPDALAEFIRLFNHQKYFESHETLEKLWKISQPPDRGFYQGLIQSAVSLHHAMNYNARGARYECDRAVEKLSPFFPSYKGMELESFSRNLSRYVENPVGEPPALKPVSTKSCKT